MIEIICVYGFINELFEWKVWFDVVDFDCVMFEQFVVLEESYLKVKMFDYYCFFVYQLEILCQWLVVFNVIMYVLGGLLCVECEFVSVVVLCVNGCVYCVFVYVQCFEQFVKCNDVIKQVFEDLYIVGMNVCECVIVLFLIDLILCLGDVCGEDLQLFKVVGLMDVEIFDLIYVVVIFVWVNCLMLNLGEFVFLDVV